MEQTIKVPIIGEIIEDKKLGNKVVYYMKRFCRTCSRRLKRNEHNWCSDCLIKNTNWRKGRQKIIKSKTKNNDL